MGGGVMEFRFVDLFCGGGGSIIGKAQALYRAVLAA